MTRKAPMKKYPPRASRRSSAASHGFTMMEIMIALALLAIIGTLALPALFQTARRARVNSFLGEFTGIFYQARQEAIRIGRPVVVRRDLTRQEFQVFANVDEDDGLLYQPDAAKTRGTADYELKTLALPANDYFFEGPDDGVEGADSVDGLSSDSNGEPVAVFRSDGSIEDVGAFRISETSRPYYFEVRIEPAATARIEVRKYYESPPFGATGFYPKGVSTDGDPLWRWDS